MLGNRNNILSNLTISDILFPNKQITAKSYEY